MLIGKILAIIIVAVVLFFTSRTIQREMKKRKSFKILSFISNPDGSHMLWRCGKVKDKDKLDKMMFMKQIKVFGVKAWSPVKGESMPVINPAHIVSNTVHLFRYGISQYAVIPPQFYRDKDVLKKNDITLINMNMLTFKGLEQRAAISRWASLKDKMAKLTPWITLFLIVVVGGVAIYFIAKMALTMFGDAIAARTIECAKLIPQATEVVKPVVDTISPLA